MRGAPTDFVLLAQGFALEAHGFALLAHGFALLAHGFALLAQGFALLAHGFVFTSVLVLVLADVFAASGLEQPTTAPKLSSETTASVEKY
ncbi:hypothetical protein ACQ4M3_33610 [Leptolyngbya sp. AN03gr2]|uniref:hypothetical protein n=1 Tax=unclassified Leptolyngbya TaxID=2650499 RepID=UPI003D3141FD